MSNRGWFATGLISCGRAANSEDGMSVAFLCGWKDAISTWLFIVGQRSFGIAWSLFCFWMSCPCYLFSS